MSDITKIRDWEDTDGCERDPRGEWYWPGPSELVESRVSGDLRTSILTKLGRAIDDPCDVRIIERFTIVGYSEYTEEHYFDVEVWIHEGRQSQRVYETTSYAGDKALAQFIEWAGVDA